MRAFPILRRFVVLTGIIVALTFASVFIIGYQLPSIQLAYIHYNPTSGPIDRGYPVEIRLADVNRGLYKVLVDGGETEYLANPQWSPDGQRLAFFSSQDGNVRIQTINWWGGQPRLISEGSGSYSWSPDGRFIVHSRSFAARDSGVLYISDVTTGETREVIELADNVIWGAPQWSPDGRHILFTASNPRETDYPDIFIVTPDGEHIRQIAPNNRYDYDVDPTWSPDSQTIAFYSTRDGIHNLYLMDSNGDTPRRLSSVPGVGRAVWSPDGRRIAFSGRPFNNTDLFLVNADGSGLRLLADTGRGDGYPSWSPDGRQLAFRSYSTGSTRIASIHIMDLDGGEPRRVLRFAYDASWRPG